MPLHQSRQSDGYPSVIINTGMNCVFNRWCGTILDRPEYNITGKHILWLSPTSIKIRLNNDAPLQYLARSSYKRSACDEEETMLLGVGLFKKFVVPQLFVDSVISSAQQFFFGSWCLRDYRSIKAGLGRFLAQSNIGIDFPFGSPRLNIGSLDLR